MISHVATAIMNKVAYVARSSELVKLEQAHVVIEIYY